MSHHLEMEDVWYFLMGGDSMQEQQRRDVHATLTLSYTEALNGTTRTLILPSGRQVTVSLPAGTYNGEEIRFENQGEIPSGGGPPGALILSIAVAPVGYSPYPQQGFEDSTEIVAPPPPPPSSSSPNYPAVGSAGAYTNSSPQRSEPSSGGFAPPIPAFPITSPGAQRPAATGRQPWFIFIGVLLVIALVIGGVLIGTRVTPVSTPPSVPTTIQTNQVPKGAALYSATSPGSPCDKNGGRWVNYNSPIITCQPTNVEISDPQANLAGTLLINLPGTSTFPSNYVIEAQLQQASSSHADFGIYFRNQPGGQQGIYTFLVHPDGSWSSYVYDNTTGNPTPIASGGSIGSAYSPVVIDIVVNGANFSFYVNGQHVGDATDRTYSIGTVGIAVDTGGTIFASNFTLYALAA